MTVSKLSNLIGYSIKDLRYLFAYSQGDAVFWHNLLRSGEGDFRTRHAGCPVLKGWKWGEFDIWDYKYKGRLADRNRKDLNQLKNQALEHAPPWPAVFLGQLQNGELKAKLSVAKIGWRRATEALKHETVWAHLGLERVSHIKGAGMLIGKFEWNPWRRPMWESLFDLSKILFEERRIRRHNAVMKICCHL